MIKLLVVEDDLDLCLLCVKFFQFSKYEVLGVLSKTELYENLDSFTPDVILIDVMLANDDGREICRDIKKSGSQIKIILVSAREDLLENYKEYNSDFSFLKPYSIKEIAKKIDELMRA